MDSISQKQDDKMKLKIKDLVDSHWILEKVDDDHVKVYYKAKKGIGPKPFIFPKEIVIDEFVSECIAMYLGDGKLSSDLHHCDFTNKDIDLVAKMLDFFRKLGVTENDITFTIDYQHGDVNKISEDIVSIIGDHKFRLNKTDRNKFPSLHMQVNGKIFRIFMEKLIHKSLDHIKKEGNLRKSWLRGYFSAEGSTGYSYTENYMVAASFAYNPNKEVWLRDYCLDLLMKEGIEEKIKIRHEEHNGQIIITNWKNYYKMWKLGIFDGCARKKEKFEKILKRVKITCGLKDDFRRELFSGINQYEIAELLGTYQASISNMINGTTRNIRPTVEHLKKICEIKTVSIEDVKRNVTSVRFGNLTEMKLDDELLDDIFNR